MRTIAGAILVNAAAGLAQGHDDALRVLALATLLLGLWHLWRGRHELRLPGA